MRFLKWLVIVGMIVVIGCEEWFAQEESVSQPEPGPNSCRYANNGVCDLFCHWGTDTADCALPDSCIAANDGTCDEGTHCWVGTDTSDCDAEPEPEPRNTAAPECLSVTEESSIYDRWTNVCDSNIQVWHCLRMRHPEFNDYICGEGLIITGANQYYTDGMTIHHEDSEWCDTPVGRCGSVVVSKAEEYGGYATAVCRDTPGWRGLNPYNGEFISDETGAYGCYPPLPETCTYYVPPGPSGCVGGYPFFW